MNEEELRKTIEEIRAQLKAKPENKDKTEDEVDEEMLDGFFKSYTEGELSKEDLEAIAGAMGYEFTDEFENDPEAANEMEQSPAEGLSQEDLENTRTFGEGEESKEEFKEEIENAQDKMDADEGEEEGEDEEDEELSEDEEREQASKLWKTDLTKK